MWWFLTISSLAIWFLMCDAELPDCTKKQVTFTYTECDLSGGRWRVQVPQNPDICRIAHPDAPQRGRDCGFSCDAGYYLNLQTQICVKCKPGTFSLGSGVRFDEWHILPDGFTVSSEAVTFSQYGYHSKVNNCDKSLWKPVGQYIISNDDDCTSSLSYSVSLEQDGFVQFSYQYSDNDVMFHFYVQNSQCQTSHESGKNVFLNTTGTDWNSWKVPLKSGLNVLYWKTTGILLGNRHKVNPVRIRSIEITGVSYTTECHKCRPGFYAPENASHWCDMCPVNTRSEIGASRCTPCNEKTQYSPQASANCLDRPACTDKNYFATHSSCSVNKTTKIMYKWVEPKVCLDSLPASVQLPPSGQEKPCAPCNPGYAPSEHKCIPCHSDSFSDGTSNCTACPANTSPHYGFWYLWWDSLPGNMKTSCVSLRDTDCVLKEGWVPAGDEIRTVASDSKDAFLILVLSLKEGFLDEYAENEFGRITFAFQLDCTSDCQFYFMKDLKNTGSSVLHGWSSQQPKQTYSYVIDKKEPVTFSWAFRKSDMHPEDSARLFFVKVTNTAGGSADKCTPCATGQSKSKNDQCIPCPSGTYVNESSHECVHCPADSKVLANKTGCELCGEGTHPTTEQSFCENDCSYQSKTGRHYDFQKLSSAKAAVTSPTFTSSGRKYSHVYNVSLCGNEGQGRAQCVDNVTSAGNGNGNEKAIQKVNAMVCRSTAIPMFGAQREQLTIHSQPTVLASVLTEVTQLTNDSADILPPSPFPKDAEHDEEDVIYHMSSADSGSDECPSGRHVYFHLRCDPKQSDSTGNIEMPTKCPDGTCEGCNFHFLWRSIEACPICSEVDYEEIAGSCEQGKVTTKYVWKTYPKKCHEGTPLPASTKAPCNDYTFYIEVGSIGGAVILILMCTATCCFWKKSKKLEYKYHRLVVNSRGDSSNGGLPAADSCAISDSESDFDGQSDEVIFQKKKSRIFSQKKNDYESVKLQPMTTGV